MTRLSSCLCVPLVLALATPALADWQVRVVARAGPDEPFGVAPVQARVGESVELALVLIEPDGDVLADAERVRLGRRARRPDGPLPEDLDVRWLRVVPRREHLELTPPNAGIMTFSNNVLFGPDHGDWLGYDVLEYEVRPLVPSAPTALSHGFRVDRAEPSWGQPGTGGAGSNWFAVELTLANGTVVRSPDADDLDRYGLTPNVLRVSFRRGDGFLDWLGTYFNVPHVFGSTGPSDSRHQTDRYVGADCADALVGARRAGGANLEYSSVAGIGSHADAVSDVLFIDELGGVRDADGLPVTLRWGDDVRPGDLLAIDFSLAGVWLPRQWDHIGALASDGGPSGPNGRFDGFDVLRHMSRRGLVDVPLWGLGPIRVRIWRWD